MNIEILISFVFATAVLAISPGPDNIYVLTQSVTNGKKFGLATTAGLITGCIIHTTLLAFGVSALIKENESIFLIIKILGAVYLLYLAYQVYKLDAKIQFSTEGVPQKSLKELFVQGFIMNVLNPKVTLFFLAFFPGFLFSEDLSTVVQFCVLGGVFMLVSFIIFSLIAILSSEIKKFTEHNEKAPFLFKWLQIIVFIAIAIFILL